MDRSEVFDGPGLTGLVDLHDSSANTAPARHQRASDPGRKIFEVRGSINDSSLRIGR
jgi:hypothetical protein